MRKLLYILIIGIIGFLAVSDADAYFSADSFSFPAGNPYSSGQLSYFSGVVFKNVRLENNGPIVYTTLTGGYGTTDTNLGNDLNNQLVQSVFCEVASLGNCNIYQYTNASRFGTGLFCPGGRAYSGALNLPINVFGPTGPTGYTGATGPTGATGQIGSQGNDGYSAYELAQINGFTGSEIEWFATLVGPVGATGETVHQVVFSSGAEIFSGASFVVNQDDGAFTPYDGSGIYLPLWYENNGNTYVNEDRLKQVVMEVIFFAMVGGAFWYFIIRKILGRRKEEQF